MAYINGIKTISNILYTGSATTDALKAIVECNHKHEITGDTGNEHGLAISDQQMLLQKINGQTVAVNGELVHSNCNLISTGRNLFDEQVLNGELNSTGVFVSNTISISSKNYNPIVGGKTYYFRTEYTNSAETNPTVAFCFYDKNKTFISKSYKGLNKTFTAPNDACYFKIGFPAAYGTVYKNDVCVNVNDQNFNGTYEPYKQELLTIGEQLKAFDYINNLSGKLVKATSETVVLNGSENWTFGRTYTATDATDPTLYRFDLAYDISSLFDKTEYRGSAICNRMTWNHDTEFKDIKDCQITVNTSGTIIYVLLPVEFAEANGIKTDENAASFKIWLSNNILKFVYKLAAPTEVIDIGLPSGYAVYKNGLQIQDGNIPYMLTKEYALNANAQILANVEIDREQQEQINELKQNGSSGSITYLTTPPTSDNEHGLKIVLLDSSLYPLTSITPYIGYMYMWY